MRRLLLPFLAFLFASACLAARVDVSAIRRNLQMQVDLGPRPPGSEQSAQLRNALLRRLRSYGLRTTTDSFEAETPRGRMTFANVVGETPSRVSKPLIIIAAHYDTKQLEGVRFVGANDGASGVAGLLEIARIIGKARRSDVTYRFVFFDGEEALCLHWSQCMEGNDNTYGSRHEVQRLVASGDTTRVKAMILLDMIGDRELVLRRDRASTPWLVETIWGAAKRRGAALFSEQQAMIGGDDHLPFIAAGIPAVDIIDLEYPHWHRESDTLDKVSAENIATVCRVVLDALPEIAARR